MELLIDWGGGLSFSEASPAASPATVSARRRTVPTLFIIRHAHTSDNSDDIAVQRVRGSRDVEPDAQGYQEAADVGEQFAGVQLTKIYTSGKKRARIVAEAIAHVTGAPLEIDAAAESWNRGELEGQTVKDALEQMQFFAENPDQVPPNGESRNAWLTRFSGDLRAKLGEAETVDAPIAYVTHMSNILAVPSIVANDPELLPFPSKKFKTAEMLALTKPDKDWKWRRYVHLSDCMSPVNIASHRNIVETTSARLALLLREAIPGTALVAINIIRASNLPGLLTLADRLNALGSIFPQDEKLAASIQRVISPVVAFGRDAVYGERTKVLGDTGLPPQLNPELPAPAASIARSAVFDFAQWVVSREMAGIDISEEPEDEFNLEADLLRHALGAAGLPARQLAREIVTQALCQGRRLALTELKEEVISTGLAEGLPCGKFL